MGVRFEKVDDWVNVPVDLKVYPLQSIHSAGYSFMDRAHVRLEEEKKGIVSVWLKAKNDKQDLQKLALEFSDELLNYAHYFSSLKTNAENMKVLLQRALFSASPSIVKEAEEKEIENLIKELEAEEKQTSPKSKNAAKAKK
jgi:His-Xaa-Ser system protein HxsD